MSLTALGLRQRIVVGAGMEETLVLNATYEPLRIVSWQKAVTLQYQGKVEVIALHAREIRGVTVRVRLPSVLRLHRHVRMKRSASHVPFSRTNVYARDEHRCQYCGEPRPPSELTFDHVIPVARGGEKAWENIVTCCIPCNRRKGDRTPEEAGLRLIRRPHRPRAFAALTPRLALSRAPESWRDYVPWALAWDGN